jgi:hypothetical protein
MCCNVLLFIFRNFFTRKLKKPKIVLLSYRNSQNFPQHMILAFVVKRNRAIGDSFLVISVVYNRFQYSVVGNSMASHNGHLFTTLDRDNDGKSGSNCAIEWHGAWWYRACANSNLNAEYGGPGVSGYRYNHWHHWKSNRESLKETYMMVRPKA